MIELRGKHIEGYTLAATEDGRLITSVLVGFSDGSQLFIEAGFSKDDDMPHLIVTEDQQ